jgi:hypothetical protein
MIKEQVHRLLMKTNSLRLKQESFNLDKKEGNLDVERELVDDIKVIATQ